MAIYQQSTLTLASAKSMVAAAAGGEGDTTNETLAQRAIEQALGRWNTYWPWQYLKTTSSKIQIYPAVSVPMTGAYAAGDSVLQGPIQLGYFSTTLNPKTAVTTTSQHRMWLGDNYEITYNTTNESSGLVALAAGGLTYLSPAGSTATFIKRDYDLPSDVRSIYDVRMLVNGVSLAPSDQRAIDHYTTYPEPQVGNPTHYTLFNVGSSATASIRLYPAPVAWDQMEVRYWRRAAVFTAATATATVLDVPQDAEFGILSLAKAYMLADRGGEPERMALWMQEGEQTLRTFRAREQQEMDQLPGFMPSGAAINAPYSQNDVRPFMDN